MRSALITGPGQVEVVDVDPPRLTPGHVLVAVEGSEERGWHIRSEVVGVPYGATEAVSGADVAFPATEEMTFKGVTYHVQSHGPINMVMSRREGRWVCLMAKLPISRLIELAGSLRF